MHTPDSKDDEGNRENLSHVEWERGLEGFLDLLGVFDEKAEGEDIRQTEAEIPTCADLLWHSLMQIPHNAKEDSVGDGLVELSWMAGHHVDTLKDKGPGHISDLADNLGIHQVAEADEAGGGSCGDGDVVEDCPDA